MWWGAPAIEVVVTKLVWKTQHPVTQLGRSCRDVNEGTE